MECGCAGKNKTSCMDINNLDINIELLEAYIIKYNNINESNAKGSLIAILQKAQEIYGYLPVQVIAYIACRIGVKPAKIMSVVTFYTQFRTKPIGKYLILLCQGTACHVNGSALIEKAIKEAIGVEEGEISQNGLFTYTNVACLGCCSLAPVMMIGEKTYGGLTRDKTIKILKDIEQGEKSQ